MTGKYPTRVGITDYINPAGRNQPASWNRNTKLLPAAYQDRLALDETTLAEAFKGHGYATFFAGKWHMGPEGFYPENQGFDVNIGGYESGGPYGGDKYFSPYGNPRLEDGPDGEHLPDRLGREAAAFIREHESEPFLTYLSFYSVHTPLMARQDLERKYRAKARRMGFHGPSFIPEGTREARQKQEHAVYGRDGGGDGPSRGDGAARNRGSRRRREHGRHSDVRQRRAVDFGGIADLERSTARRERMDV